MSSAYSFSEKKRKNNPEKATKPCTIQKQVITFRTVRAQDLSRLRKPYVILQVHALKPNKLLIYIQKFYYEYETQSSNTRPDDEELQIMGQKLTTFLSCKCNERQQKFKAYFHSGEEEKKQKSENQEPRTNTVW